MDAGRGVIYDPTLRQACQGLFYRQLDPETRAFYLNQDLAATVVARLGGPAAPTSDITDAPLAGPGFLSFPGVGIDPVALAELTGRGAPPMSANLMLTAADFRTPAEKLALAQALIATGQLSLSPAGGMPMSAPFFGLSGSAPGGTTPILPFGFPSSAGGGFVSTMDPFSSGVTGILSNVLNLGGQFFLQRQAQQAQEDLARRQLQIAQALAMSGAMSPAMMSPAAMFAAGGRVTIGDNGEIGMAMGMSPGLCVPGVDPGCIGPVLPSLPAFQPGGCGGSRQAVTVTPADAAGLYRQGCGPCGSTQLITRNRFFALRSDGTRDLFVKVGKVQSVSQRTLTRFARRWAKEAKLTVASRGRGRGSRRRPR